MPPIEIGPLADLPLADLRGRRSQLQAAEQALSYVRRLVQGRLDIVLDERQHRADGIGTRDLSALVADLPKILSEHTAAGAGRGALPEVTLPAGDLDAVDALLDGIVDPTALGSLPEYSDVALAEVADGLAAFERRVSEYRRRLHACIDLLQEEIIRRYKSGAASVDALLP